MKNDPSNSLKNQQKLDFKTPDIHSQNASPPKKKKNNTEIQPNEELKTQETTLQFGTQVKFRWSHDHNNRTAENAFSAPWYYSEMELEPAAG